MARDTQYTLYKTARTDPTFKNIWAFLDEGERERWLNTCSPHPFLNNKYWRVGSTIKCAVRYEESFNYDYVRIVNRVNDPNNTSTWFCFITGRQYISNNCTLFTLAVDYVQTFYFSKLDDGGLGPFWMTNGFIVRSTAPILPPRGTPSEYPVTESSCYKFDYGKLGYSVVIYSSVDIRNLSTLKYTSAIIDGQYTASPPYVMLANVEAISNLINDINTAGYTDAISGIYLIPNDYLNITKLSTTPLLATDSSLYLTVNKIINKPTACDGYVPVNKELLGYDYSYFTINNGQGEISTWHFEDFNGAPSFSTRLALASGSPVIIMYPNNYINADSNEYRQQAIKITQAPACSFLNDTFKIWLAQTQNSRAAAINAAQLSVDQAKFARDNSLRYQMSKVANPILDYITNNDREALQSAYKNYETVKKYGTINGKSPLTNLVETISPWKPTNLKRVSTLYDRDFGGGESDGNGGGRSFGTGPTPGGIIDTGVKMAELYIKNELGIENWYIYDQNVASAQANMDKLLAYYSDKSRVPATATGSNAYGDACVLQQYGFMIAVYTPTAFYAEWIDKQLSASGHNINVYSAVSKYHGIFDYYMVASPYIKAERDGRPQYARNMLISLLTSGVYLWYVYNGDISPKIGLPYGINNPDV